MKAYAIALMGASVLYFSAPALAGSDRLMELLNATQRDFETVKNNFRAAYTAGYSSWDEYGRATGFSIEQMERRINRRRAVLEALGSAAGSPEAEYSRGVSRMVIRDLDRINLSLLVLIRDDRGYAGYIATADKELVGNVSGWQEGIRQELKEAKRSIGMLKMVSAQGQASPLDRPASAQ